MPAKKDKQVLMPGSSSESVLTPGGYRQKSLVHHIVPGHYLDLTSGIARMMHSSGSEVANFGPLQIKPGAKPLMIGNIASIPSWLPPNWITYAFWNNYNNNNTNTLFKKFHAEWVVPPAPATDHGQTIYLFNSIEGQGILQPVLQWGPSNAGGGSYWAVASWFVCSDEETVFNSDLVRVNPGDVLVGEIRQTGHWNPIPGMDLIGYVCEFVGIANTSLQIAISPNPSLPFGAIELPERAVALEAYGVKKCSDYPNATFTAFTGINYDPPIAQWMVFNRITDCGQKALVVSNSATAGQVNLYYKATQEGYFAKWFNDGSKRSDFQLYREPRYIGGAPGSFPGAQLIPCNLTGNSNGRTDFIVFRPGDGYFGKWFNDGNTGSDFQYIAPPKYIGGAPGSFPGAQLIPCDLNGNKKTDFIVFRSSDGYFGKWFNDGNKGPDFKYIAPPKYIGGAPGKLPGAQLIPCDLDGDGKTDFVVFRPSDGYFGKWFNDGNMGPDFQYIAPPKYIGGAPGCLPGAQLIPCDLTGDGKTDFVVFRSSDGYFAKWFNDGSKKSDFQIYGKPRYIGGAPGSFPGAQLIPCDLTGDGKTDFVVFRPGDGYFGKWFNDGNTGSDFQYIAPPKYIGGAPGSFPGAQLIPCDLNGDRKTDFIVFRPGDGYFGKWFNDGNTGSDFQYIAPPKYIGGAPGSLPGAQLIPCDLTGDGKTDFIVFRS